MATGRRDYTAGYLKEATSEGRYGTTFIEEHQIIIDSGGYELVYDYLVPVGYQLLVDRIMITTSSKVDNIVNVITGLYNLGSVYFSDYYLYNFSEDAPLKLGPEDFINVSVLNNDDIPGIFGVVLIGILEQLTV